MSRIGNTPIDLPKDVTLEVDKECNNVSVKGPKGELYQKVDNSIAIKVADSQVILTRSHDSKKAKSFHGLYRSLINNMVKGVSSGFVKQLELVGVGYKASVSNNLLELDLGYSHNIFFLLPKEIEVKVEVVKGKNPVIYLKSIDCQLLGQVAAKIRSLRKIEPYKGKGVRFVGENVKLKAGKSASKK